MRVSSNLRFIASRRRIVVASFVLMIVLVLASPARSSAAPSASLMSGFAEGTRLGEASTLSATLKLTGNEYHGEPLPLSQVTLRMPKGTVLSNAGFPTCAT